MDNKKSNLSKLKHLRHFKIGDTVTRIMESGHTTIDKLSSLQTGPYEVIEIDPSGVDYVVQKIGSSNKPIRCHIDALILFKTFEAPPIDCSKQPVAPKTTEYVVNTIMGVKSHSARGGGGKSFLVQWADNKNGTVHD